MDRLLNIIFYIYWYLRWPLVALALGGLSYCWQRWTIETVLGLSILLNVFLFRRVMKMRLPEDEEDDPEMGTVGYVYRVRK